MRHLTHLDAIWAVSEVDTGSGVGDAHSVSDVDQRRVLFVTDACQIHADISMPLDAATEIDLKCVLDRALGLDTAADEG